MSNDVLPRANFYFPVVEPTSRRSIIQLHIAMYRGNNISAFLRFVDSPSSGVSPRGQTIILLVLSLVPAIYLDFYLLIPTKDLGKHGHLGVFLFVEDCST